MKITTDMLDQFGPTAHNTYGCARVRRLLAAAGVTVPIELHAYEIEDVKRLRAEAAASTKAADAIEARGPWPVHLAAPEAASDA